MLLIELLITCAIFNGYYTMITTYAWRWGDALRNRVRLVPNGPRGPGGLIQVVAVAAACCIGAIASRTSSNVDQERMQLGDIRT